jgi:hypothetical protein
MLVQILRFEPDKNSYRNKKDGSLVAVRRSWVAL